LADNVAASLRDLLMLLGRGAFDQRTTAVLESAHKFDLESELKKYLPEAENGFFKDIIVNIFLDIRVHIN